jgi:hypothetical protein
VPASRRELYEMSASIGGNVVNVPGFPNPGFLTHQPCEEPLSGGYDWT